MSTLLLLYVAAGILLVGLALPLLFEKIPPNAFYGFRLAPVFDSDAIWYATNKYAAKWLIATGGGFVTAAVTLYLFPGLTVDQYAIACVVVLFALLAPTLVFSLKFARRMARR